MMCGTNGAGEKKMGQGMISGHAYALLSHYELTTEEGEEVKLLKLRNPWGQGEWTGDWSDNSEKWTEDLKEKVKFELADDGIFHMNFDDYM